MKLFFTLLLASLPSLGSGQTCNYPFVAYQSGVCNQAFEVSVSDIVADSSCNAAPSNGGVGPGPFYRATCDPTRDLLFFLSAVCSDAGCTSCRDNNLYVDNNNARGWDVSSGDCNALSSVNSFRVIGGPTRAPSPFPTTSDPTISPTTASPVLNPTVSPSTGAPSVFPSAAPSPLPTTSTPTLAPTTASPTFGPTVSLSNAPTDAPISAPTVIPSAIPSPSPTTSTPTSAPTTAFPTISPTSTPTLAPTTMSPTVSPTFTPTLAPTTMSPTGSPTFSAAPTRSPTWAPVTAEPTAIPSTSAPTSAPTEDNMCLDINRASCAALMSAVPASTSCDCYSFCGEAFDQCFEYDVDGVQIGSDLTIGDSADNIIDVVCDEVYVAGCTDEDRFTASPTSSPVDDPTASPVSPSTDGPTLSPSVDTSVSSRDAPSSGATTWIFGIWSAVVGLGLAAFMY